MRFMRLVTLIIFALATLVNAQATQPTAGKMSLGVVINQNEPYNCPGAWSDVSHGFSGWFAGPGVASVTYTTDGYPLTNGAQAQSLMLGCPAGVYKLSYQGTGTIAVKWATASNVASSGGVTTMDVTVPKANNQIYLTATNLNPADPLHAMHLYAPGYSAASPIFRSEFTKWLSPFSVIRPLDWSNVNIDKSTTDPTKPTFNPATTQPSKWVDRVQPTAWDQTTRGTAYEFQFAICKQTGAIPWINVPYTADDDYIISLAKLAASYGFQVVIFERSNEIWNNAFGQWQQNYDYANDPKNLMQFDGNIVADVSGNTSIVATTQPSTDANTRATRAAAEQARRLGILVHGVLGSHAKVVIGAQAYNTNVATIELNWLAAKYGDVSRTLDAIAIAPYFPYPGPPNTATIPQITAVCQACISGNLAGFVSAHNVLAQKFGIGLVGYEGGQSFYPLTNPPGGATDFPTLLMSDPAIGQLYSQWLSMCQANGMSLINHNAFISPWSKSGLWSLQQDLAEQPSQRWKALSAFAALPVIPPQIPATQPANQATITVDGKNYLITVVPQ